MLRVVQTTIPEARAGVLRLHRHLPRVLGGMVAFMVVGPDGDPVGYAIVGRPSSRILQAKGWTEVTRCATDGTRNACSALYGAGARWALRNGHKIITYTLPHEGGASLRGAGWLCVGRTRPQRWSGKGRERDPERDVPVAKLRWTPPWCADHAPAEGRIKPTARP